MNRSTAYQNTSETYHEPQPASLPAEAVASIHQGRQSPVEPPEAVSGDPGSPMQALFIEAYMPLHLRELLGRIGR